MAPPRRQHSSLNRGAAPSDPPPAYDINGGDAAIALDLPPSYQEYDREAHDLVHSERAPEPDTSAIDAAHSLMRLSGHFEMPASNVSDVQTVLPSLDRLNVGPSYEDEAQLEHNLDSTFPCRRLRNGRVIYPIIDLEMLHIPRSTSDSLVDRDEDYEDWEEEETRAAQRMEQKPSKRRTQRTITRANGHRHRRQGLTERRPLLNSTSKLSNRPKTYFTSPEERKTYLECHPCRFTFRDNITTEAICGVEHCAQRIVKLDHRSEYDTFLAKRHAKRRHSDLLKTVRWSRPLTQRRAVTLIRAPCLRKQIQSRRGKGN